MSFVSVGNEGTWNFPTPYKVTGFFIILIAAAVSGSTRPGGTVAPADNLDSAKDEAFEKLLSALEDEVCTGYVATVD